MYPTMRSAFSGTESQWFCRTCVVIHWQSTYVRTLFPFSTLKLFQLWLNLNLKWFFRPVNSKIRQLSWYTDWRQWERNRLVSATLTDVHNLRAYMHCCTLEMRVNIEKFQNDGPICASGDICESLWGLQLSFLSLPGANESRKSSSHGHEVWV